MTWSIHETKRFCGYYRKYLGATWSVALKTIRTLAFVGESPKKTADGQGERNA
jgi:hypothetical protein